MSIDESRRQLLHDAARDAWGHEAALALMEMLPPTGWADVATRRDLDALETRMDARFEIVDARFDALRFELHATFERGQRRAIQWNVATLIAAVAAVTAIVRLG